MESQPLHPFDRLTPELIMDAVEAQGYLCDGRNLALNSYENRVYQVGLDEQQPVVVKFYRPDRWSREQIVEEHLFCYQLEAQDLPVVTPIRNESGESLHKFDGFMFAVYPRKGGRAPELDNLDHLYHIGQVLGRMHAIGATENFRTRPEITIDSYGQDSVEYVLKHAIPDELRTPYETLCRDLLKKLQQRFADVGKLDWIRVHGDCHVGNMLWRDDAPHFVDFDDSRMAPAIQDIWLLLSGQRHEQQQQLSEIIEGYREFYDFQPRELNLVEAFRTLRMINYAAWLARRWNDPAFPLAFPWFNSVRYWSDHILELREQLAALDEPALKLL